MFHISKVNRHGVRLRSLKCKIKKIGKKLYYGRKLIRDNSPSSDRTNLKHISSESPLRDASNGGIFMRLASLDGELFVKNCFWKFRIISSSIDPRRMKMPPFDVSRHGDFDDMRFKFIRSLDRELSRINFLP